MWHTSMQILRHTNYQLILHRHIPDVIQGISAGVQVAFRW